MSARPITVRKLKEILRLKFQAQLAHRQIALSLHISPSTVSYYLNRAAQLDITAWPLCERWDDVTLERAFLSTRAVVDVNGMITQPTVNGPPKGNNKCPAGDSCPNAGAYTYSDFTGFGLRNFTRPSGTYQVLVKGCTEKDGAPIDTQWWAINWDADVPPNTSLVAHAKAADSSNLADASWQGAAWTPDFQVSPADLLDEEGPAPL